MNIEGTMAHLVAGVLSIMATGGAAVLAIASAFDGGLGPMLGASFVATLAILSAVVNLSRLEQSVRDNELPNRACWRCGADLEDVPAGDDSLFDRHRNRTH